VICATATPGIRESDPLRALLGEESIARFDTDAAKVEALAHAHGVARWGTDLDGALQDPSNAVFFDAFLTVVTSDEKRSNAYRIKLPRPQLLETQQEIATTVALSKLGIDASTVTVSIGVSTYAAEGLLIDRSAFHFVKLPSTSVHNARHSDSESR
jgi:hypothetical protein